MKNRKKKRKWWMYLRNTFITLLSVIIIWFVFHRIMTSFEKEKYPAVGQFVEIDNKKMHVFSKGNGENTIVLLPGLGTAAPVLDFEPLLNELSKDNQVVVVEPFGYGWSDFTKQPRTVENIVHEIRMALKESHIKGPYTLMPHSVSGIYSMYYANQYPDEIKAIIGIDFTLPMATEYFKESAPTMPEFLKYTAPTGLIRAATYFMEAQFLPLADAGTYSEKNLTMTKSLSAWKAYNHNVVEEANELSKNIEKTKEMSFSPKLPVMIFTTKEEKEAKDGKNNVTFYQTQLSGLDRSEIVILEGHHYLHWTQYQEMSKEVNEFLAASKVER